MFEGGTELILSLIVLALGGVACVLVGRWLSISAAISAALYAWHALLSYVFSSFVLSDGGDAFVYYMKAKYDFVQADLGTDFIVWLSSFPVSIGFSYFPLAFTYHVAGAIGLLFFHAALRESAGERPGNATTFLILVCSFMPSLSFWTSGVGKDALAFLCVGLFLWATGNFARRQPAAIAAVLIMMFVRPHVAALMVLCSAIGIIFLPQLRAGARLGVGAGAAAVAVFLVPLALVYSGSTRFETIGEYISDRQEHNLEGGSSIDIRGMNPALRVIAFLYRPFPTEANGVAQLAASADNMILAFLTIWGLVVIFRAGFLRVFRQFSIPLLFGVACLIVLSQVIANLGLASRQKWMLIPALMLVLVGAHAMLKRRAEERLVGRPLPGAATRLTS